MYVAHQEKFGQNIQFIIPLKKNLVHDDRSVDGKRIQLSDCNQRTLSTHGLRHLAKTPSP